jgi:hypothetical protein
MEVVDARSGYLCHNDWLENAVDVYKTWALKKSERSMLLTTTCRIRRIHLLWLDFPPFSLLGFA